MAKKKKKPTIKEIISAIKEMTILELFEFMMMLEEELKRKEE